MSQTEIIVTPQITDFQNWWRGVSHASDFYFHNAVLELIDNAYSSCVSPASGLRPTHPTIEIILIDKGEEDHQLFVNDNGDGINLKTFKEVLMNPGSLPDQPGRLNEHGFGLKNALSYIQCGEMKEFRITSKSEDGIWQLLGPYSEKMRLRMVDEQEWNNPVVSDILKSHRKKGTTIATTVSHSVLRTLSRGSSRRSGMLVRKFSPLCDLLREHIMITYRKILYREPNLRIYVINKPQNSAEYEYGSNFFFRSDDKSIRIWNHEFEPVTRWEHTIPLRVNGKESDVHIILGRAPHDSKEPGKNYSGLNYYYNLTDARVGIDIFVRDRIVKAMEWEKIWGGTPDYGHNWFIGEVELDEKFPTRNNKTHVDLTSDMWLALVAEIDDRRIKPPEQPSKREHQDVLQFVRDQILSGRDDIMGEVKTEETTVFGESTIDMWFEVEQVGNPNLVHIYEIKIEKSNPLDLYQLRMYCDGLILEGLVTSEKPIRLHLVAPGHSEGSKKCCDYLRGRNDARGRNYDIWLEKFNITTKADGETIESVRIKPRWYPSS